MSLSKPRSASPSWAWSAATDARTVFAQSTKVARWDDILMLTPLTSGKMWSRPREIGLLVREKQTWDFPWHTRKRWHYKSRLLVGHSTSLPFAVMPVRSQFAHFGANLLMVRQTDPFSCTRPRFSHIARSSNVWALPLPGSGKGRAWRTVRHEQMPRGAILSVHVVCLGLGICADACLVSSS